MSSESDDYMSYGDSSQDSNENVTSPCRNAPITEFSKLCLFDHDSDYSSDTSPVDGKRKQQKKLKRDEQMEYQEVDAESQVMSVNSDDSENREADNEEEEESEEESGEKCDGACEQETPTTSGMKRKNYDKLESPTVPKLKKIRLFSN